MRNIYNRLVPLVASVCDQSSSIRNCCSLAAPWLHAVRRFAYIYIYIYIYIPSKYFTLSIRLLRHLLFWFVQLTSWTYYCCSILFNTSVNNGVSHSSKCNCSCCKRKKNFAIASSIGISKFYIINFI